jgi:hypothetical protein
VAEKTQGGNDLCGAGDGHIALFTGSTEQYGNLHNDEPLRVNKLIGKSAGTATQF